jgi:type IV secretory pathway TrbD component
MPTPVRRHRGAGRSEVRFAPDRLGQPQGMFGAPRLMIVVLGATAVVVAAIAVLAFQTWWALVIALGAHAIGSTLVIGYTYRRTQASGDKPDPVTEARVEEEELAERRRETGQISPARDHQVFD